MRKRMALVLVVMLLLTGCQRGGVTKDHRREIGSSDLYTQTQIHEIMDIVEAYFEQSFDGCTLLELTYRESYSAKHRDELAAQYGADRAIVFTSTFDVDDSGGDGSLNPNSTYGSWMWILTQNDGEPWVLRDWGY